MTLLLSAFLTVLFLCFQWCLSPNIKYLMFKTGLSISTDLPDAPTPHREKGRKMN